ncbi:unnamed protein product [Caenorhabditis auriculariae]|uniref:Innexin n=1 Tax=Caenorhabditis auriculariae TaxID=2777116 RepID=A0A8S1GVL6_9PELO|nr:unnamed protein product [Caenorhabditis auriculariae]
MIGVPLIEQLLFRVFQDQIFDDPVDRLNYFYTASILAFFAIMVSAKQYVGSPIQCWMPMEFKGGWEQYAEDYCFIQNTFFVPFHEEIPGDSSAREEREIGYYQWVPITLAIQAILFFIPNWIWNIMHKHSGLDLETVVNEAHKLRNYPSEQRSQALAKLASYISECLEFKSVNRRTTRICCWQVGSGLGSYISMLYLMIKLLYLGNVLLQFYIMTVFLGNDHLLWGFQTFLDLYEGREWSESGVFPRVTLCDFKVRRLANIHRYTVQCVLMINLFNEKIYLFLWLWLLAVLLCTFINTAYTFYRLAFTFSRESSVKKLLGREKDLIDDDQTDNYRHKRCFRSFTQHALRPDGVLLLRFIECRAGALVAREVTERLYNDYLEMCAYNLTGQSTKSTSPGMEEGPHESLYHPQKMGGLMEPDFAIKQA